MKRRGRGHKNINRWAPWKTSTTRDLQYCERIQLNVGIAGVAGAEQVYRLNSLFDTNFTGVGHQPYGFDQLSLMYRHYRVNGVTVQLTGLNPTSDGIMFIQAYSGPDDTVVLTGTNPGTAGERQNVSYQIMTPDSSQTQVNYRRYVDMAELSGLTRQQFTSSFGDEFSAGVTQNPTRQIVLRMAALALDQSSPHSMLVMVKLIFHCNFWGPFTQAQS